MKYPVYPRACSQMAMSHLAAIVRKSLRVAVVMLSVVSTTRRAAVPGS